MFWESLPFEPCLTSYLFLSDLLTTLLSPTGQRPLFSVAGIAMHPGANQEWAKKGLPKSLFGFSGRIPFGRT